MSATLNDLRIICADGQHNAFTALTYWRDRYWLAWRQADSHSPTPPGHIVVVTSDDAVQWEPSITIHTGGDDRDPKFFIDDQEGLHVHWGTYVPFESPGVTTLPLLGLIRRRAILSHIMQRRDDDTGWGFPTPLGRINYWIWSIVSHAPMPAPSRHGLASGNNWWAAAYHFGEAQDTSSIALFCSSAAMRVQGATGKGPCWRWHGPLAGELFTTYSEPVLWYPDDGVACLIRTEHDHAVLGLAPHCGGPWTLHTLNCLLHSAAVCTLDGITYVAGRTRYDQLPKDGQRDFPVRKARDIKDAWRTSLFRLDFTGKASGMPTLTHLLTVPSAGDTGYPGLVAGPKPGTLLLSYYSQHARALLLSEASHWRLLMQPIPADIYLAEIHV